MGWACLADRSRQISFPDSLEFFFLWFYPADYEIMAISSRFMTNQPRAFLFVLSVSLLVLGAGCQSTIPTANMTETPVTPPGASSQAPVGTSSVSISGFAFQPQNVTVVPRATITWTNNDSVPHTVTADDGSFDSGTLSPGASFTHAFASAGTVSYHCNIHPSMHGTVVVK